MRVVFRPQADVDLAEVKRWYEGEQPGLGERFRRALSAIVDHIEQFPESAPAVHGDIRRAVVPGFPYSLFYIVDEGLVVVLRVLHGARDPSGWP